MNKLRNKITSFLLVSPFLFPLTKAFAEGEIDMIELEQDNIPEMEPEFMPELPQIEEVENNVAQSATAFFNEHTLLAIIVLLVLILLVVFGVILLMAKGKRTPHSSSQTSNYQNIPEEAGAKDISSAVKSFLIRTEIIR